MSSFRTTLQKIDPNRSLSLKLVIAFLAVSLAGIGLIAVLAGRVTNREFLRYVVSQRQDTLSSQLAAYYQVHDSWTGVDTVFQSDNPIPPADPIVRPIVLVDNNGNVVYSTNSQFQNQKPSPDQVAIGVPIWSNGQLVGLLIPQFPSGPHRLPTTDSINRINHDLIIGTISAAALSLLLGLLLSWTLIRPVKELTIATRDVAQGNLEKELQVRSKDELGELTESFNRMSAKLKQSRDLRRKMTADIAHELRTPLSVILGHAEALSEGKLSPTPETFGIVYDEARQLSLLVEDLRTLSLSDAGELTLVLRPVSPRTLLERIVNTYSHRMSELNISLKLESDPLLPDVNADPNRLNQVFENLLDNALRYSRSGGQIQMEAHSKGGEVEFRIQDNGQGIPEQDLPHIFDRFYRGDPSRNRNNGGSGLGLAIAKSIIELHNGRIWAESRVGHGTSIVFALPAFQVQTEGLQKGKKDRIPS